jgi:SAM-dependent methyltransferase
MNLSQALQTNRFLRFVRAWFLPSHPDLIRLVTEGRIVISAAKAGHHATIIDVGCGRGMYLLRYSESANTTYGIEPQQQHRDYINRVKRSDTNIVLREGKAESVQLPDGAADLVVSTQCLEHITDDTAALREMLRLLKPNGRMLLSVPVPPVPDSEGNRHPVYGHKREGYTGEQLRELVCSLGFQVEWQRFCFRRPARIVLKIVEATRLPLVFVFPLLAADWLLTGPDTRFSPAIQVMLLKRPGICDEHSRRRTEVYSDPFRAGVTS